MGFTFIIIIIFCPIMLPLHNQTVLFTNKHKQPGLSWKLFGQWNRARYLRNVHHGVLGRLYDMSTAIYIHPYFRISLDVIFHSYRLQNPFSRDLLTHGARSTKFIQQHTWTKELPGNSVESCGRCNWLIPWLFLSSFPTTILSNTFSLTADVNFKTYRTLQSSMTFGKGGVP